MVEAAAGRNVKVRRISFKGSVQALRQWEPHLNQAKISRQEQNRLVQLLYDSIADNIVPERPGEVNPERLNEGPSHSSF